MAALSATFFAAARFGLRGVLGGLVVAPALLVWLTPAVPNGSTRGGTEVVALGLGTIVAAELLLGQGPQLALLGQLNYLYLLFPLAIWGALRFGARGAALTTLMVAGVAVWHTARGSGPFIGATGSETLFATACYLAAVAVTGLSLAAAVAHERDDAAAAIQHREALPGTGAAGAHRRRDAGNEWRELAERLVELAPGTPVVFTSGYTNSEILRRGLLMPDSAFLGKPFTPDMVVRLVREELGARRGLRV